MVKYRTVLVRENTGNICGGNVDITEAIQRTLDQQSAQGFVLVQSYQQQVKTCGSSEVGAVLIFAKKN